MPMPYELRCLLAVMLILGALAVMTLMMAFVSSCAANEASTIDFTRIPEAMDFLEQKGTK